MMNMFGEAGRFDGQKPLIVIASNRGPFSFTYDQHQKTFTVRRGAGGLVTALLGLAEQHDILWVAAALKPGDQRWSEQHPKPTVVEGIQLKLITIEKQRYRQYYTIISNPLLWFIQHQLWDTPRHPSINEETWRAWVEGYTAVNRQFAETIVDSLGNIQDRPVIILPQDYHLYLVPQFVREALGDQVQIQPFIHIPWPGPDAWRILPGQMREAILESLLLSDRVGFQTRKDAFDFIQCCRYYLEDAHAYGSRTSIEYRGRKIEAKTYPISIDIQKLEALARERETAQLKQRLLNFAGENRLIVRIDRIELSKNILRGLEAYRILLHKYPEYRRKINMMALLVPSRMEVAEYKGYFQQIMGLTGLINAEFSDGTWEPIRTIVGDNYARGVAAMQLYDVLLVNPLTDGMNLVAKEGVLVNQRDGVLLLSEHAGAFFELGEHALAVSPFDVYGTAEMMHRALSMPAEERAARATALRQIVKQHDVSQWFGDQVRDALTVWSNQFRKISTS